jgi:hypothetical protein
MGQLQMTWLQRLRCFEILIAFVPLPPIRHNIIISSNARAIFPPSWGTGLKMLQEKEIAFTADMRILKERQV